MGTSKRRPEADAGQSAPKGRYLSALLSQTLVAFTVEFDNEFEHRMRRCGYAGANLSLVVWSNLMRFLTSGDLSVSELAARALATEDEVKGALGCLERWRFLDLRPARGDDRPIAKRAHRSGRMVRDGWGSGRGIRSQWLVRLTEKAGKAVEIWPPLFGEIEQRWETRFGKRQLESLRQALGAVLSQVDLDLPQGLPVRWNAENNDYAHPKRSRPRTGGDPLPVLLSQLLLAFTIEFERESRVPLWLCANTLRVLGETPVPLSEIPRLTGASPETSDIGWPAKPFVTVEPDPAARRGKVARLTPLGLKVQRNYHKRVREIEDRWEARFGEENIRGIRGCLESLFAACSVEGRPLLGEGMVPAEGTVRAGEEAPALGRREVGPAARQRTRDLVAQTERFVRDPANALPHYPLWDINRGFGP
jgi:hypothetical protein